MNRQDLVNCFDSMSPTAEQRERMLNAIMTKKSEPVRVYNFTRYMSVAVAAVVAVGVFAAVYPSLKDNSILDNSSTTELAVNYETDKPEKKLNIAETSTNVENTVKEEKTNGSISEAVAKEYGTPKTEHHPQTFAMAEQETVAESTVDVYEDAVEPKNEEVDSINEMDFSVAFEMSSRAIGAMEITEDVSGGGSSVAFEMLELEQIMADEIYGTLFPAEIADGFSFVSARKHNDGFLDAEFGTADGRYMSIEILKDAQGADVLQPDDILNLKPEYGYMRFAVSVGEYYIIYNVETEDVSEVHKMVTSSACFEE